jgi:competence protein ComEC
MVVLLLMVLVSIRMTDRLGVTAWLTMAAIPSIGMLIWDGWLRRRGSSASNPWMSLVWMLVIGMAYALAHARFRERVDGQMAEWNRLRSAVNGGTLGQATQWQPVVVRGTIEETLRYRRATHMKSQNSVAGQNGVVVPTALPSAAAGLSGSGSPEAASDDVSADASEAWQSLTQLRIDQVRRGEDWQRTSMLGALVIDEKVTGLYPGDRVELYGYWRLPPVPSNPGQFDLPKRFAELGITAQLKTDSQSQLERLALGSAWRIDRVLAMMTESALRAVDRYVILGQAPLTAALVLGQREQAQWQLQEEMLATGTIHILSISGMHIEMVALALLVMGYLLRLPRGGLFVGTVLFCVLYAMLCGANPPVARATWMLTAACAARWMGWSFASLNILAVAGLLILTQRTAIAFEVGTQLSFLTVAVLILTFPILHRSQTPLERLIEARQSAMQSAWCWTRGMVWESMRSSFWVCFLSAPLVWHAFHILSPVAVVLNLLLWLPMLVALLSGLALVFAFWLPPIAWLMGILCGASLWLMTVVVSMAEAMPLGHFWLASPPMWWVLAFYGLAFSIAVWRGTQRVSARRLLLSTLGVWFLLGLCLNPLQQRWSDLWTDPKEKVLAVTWIDVGHGTCAVMELPEGSVWLYDAGRLGDHERSYQPIVNALWAMRISRLDRLVLSHADSDHYNAIDGVSQRFFPERWITTEAVLQHPNANLKRLIANAKKRGTTIDRWGAGDRYLDAQGASLTALHPARGAEGLRQRGSDNSRSLCLLLDYGGRRILLPGDLEPPGTYRLTAQSPIAVDAIMAPHHGSLSSRIDQLVEWCDPDTIVISGAARATSPKVVELYSQHGNNLWITARDHAIRVEVDGRGGMRWLHWDRDRWQPLEAY